MPDGSPGAFSASNPAEIQKLSIRQACPWCCSRLNVAGLFDGITDVGVRSQGAQFGLGFFRNFQGLHEILDDFRAHGFAAGQVLEFFVGLFDIVAAHHGLDRLGQYFPGVVQVFVQAGRVDFQLAQAFQGGFVGNQAVGETNTQVAQYGRVGQVTLPAGNRQLGRQVAEDGVGDAQVAFGVFEVDGVHLVGHGRGANFAGHRLLLEVTQRDVAPDVPVQVDQDGVEAGNGIIQLGDVVVGLDLGSVRVPVQAQALDEFFGVGGPVYIRIGRQVGVVVAHGAVDLAHDFHFTNLHQLTAQAVNHVGQFLAHGRGRGGLAMGAGQHRLFGVFLGQFSQLVDHLFHAWQQAMVQAFAQHQGVGQVVDVFGGAGEVYEFGHCVQLGHVCDLFFDQVFDRFHVVIGGAFDFLDALGIGQAEFADQLVQESVGFGRECRHFGNGGVRGQFLQPADFDGYPVTDQAVFTEDAAKYADFTAVASIDRGNGGQGGEFHRKPLSSSKNRTKYRGYMIHQRAA